MEAANDSNASNLSQDESKKLLPLNKSVTFGRNQGDAISQPGKKSIIDINIVQYIQTARRSILEQDLGRVSIQQSIAEEDWDDDLGSVDNVSSQEEVLVMKADFFKDIGDMPSLSEISMDEVVEEEEEEEEAEHITELDGVHIDRGTFVNPLTGLEMESERDTLLKVPDLAEIEEVDEEEIDTDSDFDMQPLYAMDSKDEMALSEDMAFQQLVQLDAGHSVEVEEVIDTDEIERQEHARLMTKSIELFLHNLFDKIVELAEYVDPKEVLRTNLDKHKLYKELHTAWSQLTDEQRVRTFLNRKVVEYYRRKKSFRSLAEDNPHTIKNDMEKYRNATMRLDNLLGEEEDCITATVTNTNELTFMVSQCERDADEAVAEFEAMVRRSLLRDTFEKLPGIVDYQLLKMSRLRNEVSDVRFTLIQRLHLVARLTEKLDNLENIGEGLHMREFEHLETATQALDKKIEERTVELKKLRHRCNASYHIMAHMREKQTMLRTTIHVEKQVLKELQHEKQMLRERVYKLKMQRVRIYREIDELSYQGGLIAKPLLMLDYDKTVNEAEEMAKRNEQLRWKYKTCQQTIEALEGDRRITRKLAI